MCIQRDIPCISENRFGKSNSNIIDIGFGKSMLHSVHVDQHNANSNNNYNNNKNDIDGKIVHQK